MKVLFVASVYHHLTSFHIPFMKHLQSKGYEVWAAGAEDEEVKKELSSLGFYCVDIPFNRHPIRKENLDAYRKLKNLFREEDFELVHAHTPVASVLCRFAFRNSENGQIVYTVHGFHFFKGAPLLNWIIYYQLERFTARWTDYLLTINSEDYERAMKMGYPKDRIRYVRGVGVERNEVQLSNQEKFELKRELGLAEDAIVISYIAELNKNKNHQFLLRNWKKIKCENPKAALLIIGDGSMSAEFKRLLANEKLHDIHLLGHRKDVDKLLNITDIVSLLSFREGLPRCIMEAMASGIPCIVSDTRGSRDLIREGKNGHIIPLGDDDKLVESFCSLLDERRRREEMGRAAYNNCSPFLLENILPAYSAIYDEILGEG